MFVLRAVIASFLAKLYFPVFTNFIMFFPGVPFSYLDQKLVYNANCLLPLSFTSKQ